MVIVVLILALAFFFFWKNLSIPQRVGDRLAACSWTPNCISSDAGDIAPLPRVSLDDIERYLLTHYNAVVVTKQPDYLHLVVATPRLHFKDDLEFFQDDQGIAVRSVSRVGYSDLGMNRKRIEELRSYLTEKEPDAAQNRSPRSSVDGAEREESL